MSKKSNYLPHSIQQSTKKSYDAIIHSYESFHNMTIDQLINEALDEQENKVPEHRLKVYDRILDYREHNSKILLGSSVVAYETTIKTIYKTNRVRLPDLPLINHINLRKNNEITFNDYLTKEEIIKAMKLVPLPIQARILAMVSGGLSNEEADNLKTHTFLTDLQQYHQCDNSTDALKYLANKKNNHIWVTKLKRAKTGKPYYAVFSPECVQRIALAKLNEKVLNPKLLINNKYYFARKLSEINKKHGFGYAGGHTRLRPHMLRKFHATQISTSVLGYEEESALRNYEIDELQGRGKTGVQDRYIKTNPIRQKMLYAKVVNKVSLFNQYDYKFVDGDVEIWVHDPTSENDKIRRENESLKRKLNTKNDISDELKNYINEVGYDNFRNGLSELLNEL